MDLWGLHELVGKSLIVDVDEGDGALSDSGLELHGVVAGVRSEPNAFEHPRPGIVESIELRLVEPRDNRLRDCRVFLSARHERASFGRAAEGKVLIVNIELYGPDGKMKSRGIGGVRPLRYRQTDDERSVAANETILADLERIALSSTYPLELRLKARDQLLAFSADETKDEWARSRARDAAQRVGLVLERRAGVD